MNTKTKTCPNKASNSWSLNYFIPRSLVILALTWVSTIGSLGLVTSVHAEALYRTSFEQPTFNSGDLLLSVLSERWTTPPTLSPNAATITNTVAKSGNQSVVVPGAFLDPSAGPFGPYAAIGSYRRPLLDKDGNPNGHVIEGNKTLARVDANLLLQTKQLKTPGEFFSLTIAARSGAGETLGEIGLASNGIVEAWSFNAVGGSAPTFTKAIRFNKWYHITMLHDFKNKTTSYYIDDHFLGSTPAPSTGNVLLRGAMVVYARLDGGAEGSVHSDYTARFDKFRISVHSEAPDID